MPIMNGYEPTQKIRESGHNVQIVALTANAMKEDMEKCYNIGMNEFLSKPIDITNLLKILKNLEA